MRILVTGGAGYIGSFMARRLLDGGHSVTVLDSLERGHKEAIDAGCQLAIGNLLDKGFLKNFFSSATFDAVIHFAGFISMAESVKNPGLYFENNVFTTINLLEQMVEKKIDKIVFSSTAGVYGNPTKIPIPEEHETNPTNPYGESKLTVEKILRWYGDAYGISFAILRYFNAAGASLDGTLGENHHPETHIIPLAIQTALGKQNKFSLYGTDYNTPDGTAIRDYIHVVDLVDAHLLALEKMINNLESYYYNVGTGNGYSNKQVVEMVKKITGVNFVVEESGRRSGDADTLIADVAKIKNELGFSPKYSDLETIIKTAWQWHKNQNA